MYCNLIMYRNKLTNLNIFYIIPSLAFQMGLQREKTALHCCNDLIINQADLLSTWIMKLSLGKLTAYGHHPGSPRLHHMKNYPKDGVSQAVTLEELKSALWIHNSSLQNFDALQKKSYFSCYCLKFLADFNVLT